MSYPLIWTDKGSQADHPRISKKLGYFANTSDVFLPIFGAEAQVAIKACPHIIAIKSVGRNTLSTKIIFKSHTNTCLARTRKT